MRASKEARVAKVWREQAELLVARADVDLVRRGRFRDGQWLFDVAQVRAYCERLIAESDRLAEERVVFADWTRERGKGPETFESGKRFFDDLGHCHDTRGGWPGPLAREWGTVRCEACKGKGRISMWFGFDTGSGVQRMPESKRVRCKPCKGRGYVKRHGREPAAANGDALARTARRLLATLDGRCPWAPSAAALPSECQSCGGHGRWLMGHDVPADGRTDRCPDCRGTGHNLSGVLPQVEDSEASIVAVADAIRAGRGMRDREGEAATEPGLSAWQSEVYGRNQQRIDALDEDDADDNPRTRIVPRGEHRITCDHPATQSELDAWHGRKPQRYWYATNDEHLRAVTAFERNTERLPRWRRGELLHARRKRQSRGRIHGYAITAMFLDDVTD